MTQQRHTAETEVRTIIEAWADAVRRHDYTGVLAHHDQDIVMFDVPPPLQSRGLDAYRKTWDLFFGCQRSSYAFDIEDIAITAGDDVAFAVAVMRCGPRDDTFQFRLTIGLRKIDGSWQITHEHHSVPATD
ncbi:ketosteroid isomerase-like protein [Bradyrhizobium sp. USDA 3240]